MGMFNFFRSIRKKQSLGVVVENGNNSFPDRKLKDYAKEGYAQSPTVFACIDLVAQSFARIPLRVKVSGEYVEEHPLIDLLNRPNPDEGGIEFRIAAASYYLLTGNVFIQKIKGAGGVTTQLVTWQPYEWKIKRDKKGDPVPSAYIFGPDQSYQKTFEVDPFTGDSEIMHWRSFNPDPQDNTFGQSPLVAAASSVDQANEGRRWNWNTLKNSASGSFMITASDELDPDDRKQIQQDINEKYQGARNANKFWVMGSDMKITPVSMSPHEMDWLEGLKLNAQEIASVYKVPTQLLGIEGSQTYANFSEAKVALALQATLPTLDLFVSELNRWLAPEFGENVEICYNKDDVDALEPLRKERRAELLASTVLTINEKRKILGYEPIDEPEADSLFITSSDIPLGEDYFGEDEKELAQATKALMNLKGIDYKEASQIAFDMYNDSEIAD